MKYVKRSINGILVNDTIVQEHKMGLKQYINNLCIKNVSTFKGREQAASVLINRKSILPIYVNSELLLIPTESIRSHECLYINVHKILCVKYKDKKQSIIIFDDLSEVLVPISVEKMNRQILRSQCILTKKKQV